MNKASNQELLSVYDQGRTGKLMVCWLAAAGGRAVMLVTGGRAVAAVVVCGGGGGGGGGCVGGTVATADGAFSVTYHGREHCKQ